MVPYLRYKIRCTWLYEVMIEELRYLNSEDKIKMTIVYPYMNGTFSWMELINPRETAAFVIKAQRTGPEELSVPRHYFVIEKIINFFPRKVVPRDFLDIGVVSDL
ncbi:uncharacterized protein LOC119637572 [Glossina fuscipes]|uniref:Uncharacterized protein LOC119637572 n=1 Tax=Glossina fuscipes TaxID=7396 RepID=A0A9C5Z486_9MUSC|nr:uncharacterized protein LOC119637572 [Glossina fuscipes]